MKVLRKIELLAPARNLECGIEAVNHGADAVYIGAPKFGARAAATNSMDDIGRLDPEEFERVFGPDLGVDAMALAAEVAEPRGRHMAILCARCILNSLLS